MSTPRAKRRTKPQDAPDLPVESASGTRALPLMLLLFVGSGCAALIYEIVWFQLLTLSVGSSAVSLAVVLGTFMGGMCLGSLLLPRFISRAQHPLRVYALLEAGIGVLGILILFALPYAGGLYTAIGGPGTKGLVLRALISAIVLLPPTLLMGATLPAIARYVETTPRGVSWLGFFYGGNIAGGVFGCLLAGYYLLRLYDTMVATFVAVACNAAVAALGFFLAQMTPYTPGETSVPAEAENEDAGAWRPVYVTIALSGLTALGAEVLWTRLLSLSLGATTYTFSLILAVFLIGLGGGSSIGSLIARNVKNPRLALGFCQLALTLTFAWAAALLARAMPYWPINPELSPSPWFTFQLDFNRAFWTVLPGALLWGASFPLALAAVGRRGQDPGRLVGTVYAANTLGAIIGAVVASLLMIAWLGTQQAQRVMIAIAALSAAVMLLPFASDAQRVRFTARSGVLAALTIVLAGLSIWSVAKIPPILVACGRYAVTWMGYPREYLFVGEGRNSSMAVTRQPDGVLNYHNAGKVQASSMIQDMRLQRMLGHLTTLVPESADTVLVIGCGAGVTAGAVSIDPAVKYEVIAEIEPLVPKVVSTFFSKENFSVVTNPKVHVRIDDARHYLLTTRQKFDAITSDPFDPWVKGAATLYTKEFFQVMRDHLNDDGVVTVFVQLYESGMAAVKSEVATFLEVFPNGVVFGNTHQGGGYDVVLLGQKNDRPIDIDRIEQKLRRPEYAPVAQSLSEIGFNSAIDLFSRFAAQGPMLQQWLADAQVNRDRNLRLQYLAGLGLNAYEQATIYSQMISYRQWPNALFTGSEQSLSQLRAAMTWNQ